MATYSYNLAGERTNKSLENGTATAYSYDMAGRLTNLVHSKSGTNLSTIAYAVNNLGLRTSRVEGTNSQSYNYDALGQLTNKTETGANQAWAYDAVGNRTSILQSGNTTNYSANGINQYTSISGQSAPNYDANTEKVCPIDCDLFDWKKKRIN